MTSTMPTSTPNSSETDLVFSIHNIYVKDLSFETPNNKTLEIFRLEWKPKLDLDLQMGSNELEPGLYEVVIHLTLSIKLPPEDKVAFIAEVKQAGLFALKGFTPEQLERVLAVNCPEILFPYAREAISNLSVRGGFPQMGLPPINFDAMYQQHLANRAKQAEEDSQGSGGDNGTVKGGAAAMANAANESVLH